MKVKKVIKIVKGITPLPFLTVGEKRVFQLAIDLVTDAIETKVLTKPKDIEGAVEDLDVSPMGTVEFNEMCAQFFSGKNLK